MSDNILLVDDDKEFRTEFRGCFSEYDIAEASTAEEALAFLKKPNTIDLVIMDVRMPGMGGLKALGQVRAAAPSAAIIIITGYASKDVLLASLRGQACEFIEKPFDVDKTRAIIEAVLARTRGEEENALADSKGKVEKVKHYLRRNCLKKVRLVDASALVCISPKHLSRIFKACCGTGFNQYYLERKMEKAVEMLSGTSCNINQIAQKLGYENTASFINIFSKLRGTTPARFRAKYHAS